MFVVFSTCGFLGRQRADQVSNRDFPSKEKKTTERKDGRDYAVQDLAVGDFMR